MVQLFGTLLMKIDLKVIGGSSTVNGMLYVRGSREDYDEWARLGNLGKSENISLWPGNPGNDVCNKCILNSQRPLFDPPTWQRHSKSLLGSQENRKEWFDVRQNMSYQQITSVLKNTDNKSLKNQGKNDKVFPYRGPERGWEHKRVRIKGLAIKLTRCWWVSSTCWIISKQNKLYFHFLANMQIFLNGCLIDSEPCNFNRFS